MSMQITSANEYSQHRRLLMQAASPAMVGQRRKQVESVFASIMDDPAFCVHYDRSKAVITGLGVEYEPEPEDGGVMLGDGETESFKVDLDTSRFYRRGFLDSRLKTNLPGAAYANKTVFGWTIPYGVLLIIAGGGKGKTPIAHALAGAHLTDPEHRYAVVRIGEPLSDYSSSTAEAAIALGSAMASASDIVLDSIKDLLSGGEGAAMKSGLSRGALTSISGWSSLASNLGCTIYVPVNPSSDDEDVKKLLIEVAKSNATATLFQTSGSTWEYSSRTGEGLERLSGSLQVEYSTDGVMIKSVKHANAGPVSETGEQFEMRLRATVEDYSAATSRALSQRSNY